MTSWQDEVTALARDLEAQARHLTHPLPAAQVLPLTATAAHLVQAMRRAATRNTPSPGQDDPWAPCACGCPHTRGHAGD